MVLVAPAAVEQQPLHAGDLRKRYSATTQRSCMNRLVFSAGKWAQVKHDLLRAAPREAAALLLANVGRSARGIRLVADEVLMPDRGDYQVQTEISAVLRPEFVARALQRARAGHQA